MKLFPVFAVLLLAACSTGEAGDGAEDGAAGDPRFWPSSATPPTIAP